MRIILLVALMLSFSCFADIYQWKDEQGKVHYSDKKNKSEKVKQLDLNKSNVMNAPVQYKKGERRWVNCRGESEIISAKLVDQSENVIYVEVEYFYNGKHAKETNIILRPISKLDFWTHESILAEPGLNTVNIRLEYPRYTTAPDAMQVKKIEVMIRTSNYDKKKKVNYAHKITSKLFDIEHVFKKKNLTD